MSKFVYAEYLEYNYFNRNKNIQIVDKTTVGYAKRDYPAWISIFNFKESVKSYIKSNIVDGNYSISYYSEEVTFSYLWVDIDVAGDLSAACDVAIDFMNKMFSKYGVSPTELKCFFSGSKGFHIGIPAKMFGAEGVAMDNIPSILRMCLISITEAELNDKGVPKKHGIDFSKFQSTALLRMPNSKHDKSGLYKTQINPELIYNKDIDAIIGDAKVNNNYSHSSVVELKPELSKLFQYYINEFENEKLKEVDEESGLTFSKNINTSIFKIPDKGERNDMLFKQSFRLFSIREMKTSEVIDIMRCVADVVNFYAHVRNERHIDEIEFRNIINSAFKRARVQSVSKVSLDGLHDMVTEIYSLVKNMMFVPLGISDIDADLAMIDSTNLTDTGGLVVGNSYSFIGKGGTKKSLLAQQIGIESAQNHGINGIFFNLEMSKIEYFKRAAAQVFQMDFVNMVRTGQIDVHVIASMVNNFHAMFKDRLTIISENTLTVQQYVDYIKLVEDKTGNKVSLTVLDSMNAMGLGNAKNELEAAVKTTLGIKNACKEMKVANILINHVIQECKAHMRDTSLYVRGGAKVIDNCDAYFCTSSIIDHDASNMSKDAEQRDIKYYPNMMYLRYVNKRGSGRVIDKVLYLDEASIRLQNLDVDPKIYV